jgi:ABC-type branched-subunit amino acid transport system substrate-binding protein
VKKAVLTVLAVALLTGACTARNKVEVEGAVGEEESEGGTGGASDTTAAGTDGVAMFGDLPSPCGEGDLTVEASEAGKGSDKLYLGVPNDRSTSFRAGLNKELWDTSVAFAEWCNAQGGIGGLKIELIDLDAQLFEVPAVMAVACRDAFMLVGGGQVQDNLQFSGQPESDFHECAMAEVSGFAVSPEKTGSNGQVQPLPNPAESASSLWVQALEEVDPDAADSVAEVWGDLPAMHAIRNQHIAVIESAGLDLAGSFAYPATGLQDWTPLAQQVIDSGATAITFTGEPTNLGALVAKLREQGWDGVVASEANMYDPVYPQSAGGGAAQNSFLRTAFHFFEEADQWPAVQQYNEILDQYVPDHKENAMLGMQSWSAWLLFATAANACGESNGGVLTRTCVLKAADAITDWTAGGLHAPSQPGRTGDGRPVCENFVDVDEDGNFVRRFPELGSEDDDGDGFWCAEDSLVEVPENEGLGKVDPDREI